MVMAIWSPSWNIVGTRVRNTTPSHGRKAMPFRRELPEIRRREQFTNITWLEARSPY